MEKETILTGVILIIAFSAKSIMDTLQFHFLDSIFKVFNHRYWNPAQSWPNKYKWDSIFNGELKPRFFGSTTFLVAFTDAWHMSQFIYLNSIILAISINLEYPWYYNFLGIRIIYGLVFNLMFDKILIRK